MNEEGLNALFRATMRNIHLEWKSKQSLRSFVSRGESALRNIRSTHNYEQALATTAMVTEKLTAAASLRQLTFTTELMRTTFRGFSGYMIHITYQGTGYGEIFVGPTDVFDSIMWLPRRGEYQDIQDNPYTKARRRQWKRVEDFDFEVVVTHLKDQIDNPAVFDDDNDDMPF